MKTEVEICRNGGGFYEIAEPGTRHYRDYGFAADDGYLYGFPDVVWRAFGGPTIRKGRKKKGRITKLASGFKVEVL